MTSVVGIKFKDAGKLYYFSPGNYDVKKGDNVIVETARGLEFGKVTMEKTEINDSDIVSPLKSIIRVATEKDHKKHQENLAKKEDALRRCQEKIDAHKLDMKLIDVEYTFDNSKVVFYFTADGRVDFRELVKDLASVFRMRIELRQIGVRDEAKMLGGVGNCGRGLCCNTWLSDFEPVSIKMAKVQNLSLNPTKISGICGRLMCCLKFENDVYNGLKKGMPNPGEKIKTPDGMAIVADVNLLENVIKTRLILDKDPKDENGEEKLSTEFYCYGKEEIKRLGKKDHKNKKNDHHHKKDDDLKELDGELLEEIKELMKD
ncbi:MAG: stage 0 sporulation family protein [Bacillota bacterium]|nr:stage 0 sporulation family protein [Bacillota bacterium]